MPTTPRPSRPERLPRWAVAAVVAFAGPLAAATLLACGTEATEAPRPPDVETDILTPPTGLRWEPFQGIDLPVTDQGPHRFDGSVASGFDHSPAGAAVAATQATVRASVASDAQWPRIGAHMLAPGAGRDGWALARAQISITAPVTENVPRLLGYLVTRYSPEAADIEIYSRYPDDSVTRNRAAVRWRHDDWRLALPDPAVTAPPAVAVVTGPPPDLVVFDPR
ncbi:hypothetical protein ACTD5D_09895 [Nocardia takedensis]|uniref:hypothetical protein n=1 Tax=Nocardia takedensis TaxID=259390 RepID=UPI003F76C6B4